MRVYAGRKFRHIRYAGIFQDICKRVYVMIYAAGYISDIRERLQAGRESS